MPIPVSCPSCGSELRAPDTAAGRKVKCPKCTAPFTIPANGPPPKAELRADPPVPAARRALPADEQDYYDEEPYPARRRRDQWEGSEGPSIGVQLGLGIASLSVGAVGLIFALIPCIGMFGWPICAVGLVTGIAGLIVAIAKKAGFAFPIAGTSVSAVALCVSLYWYFVVVAAWNRAADDLNQFVKNAKNWPPPNFGKDFGQNVPLQDTPLDPPGQVGGKPGPVVGNLVIQGGRGEVQGQLTGADPKDRRNNFSPSRVYTVPFAAGRRYQIDLLSGQAEFGKGLIADVYLRLEDPDGNHLVGNDDGGGFPHSRIVYTAPRAGAYRLVATTLGPGGGPFTLRVQER
ncbi:MAG: pre-peptidase C-terminal domain-containing protein [Gemmataceae bacterium]|nr:pre-peptidase C-terminal domain-containing protein [Gemmataceae bacterium]